MKKKKSTQQKTILISVSIITFAIIVSAYILSGGFRIQPTIKEEFKLPDSFISMQGNIIAVRAGGCNKGYLRSEDLITSDDCEELNNLAPCIRIPLSLISYYEKEGKYEYFTDKLSCGGGNKPYCQIKMDEEIIKEGCFDLGLEAITLYADKPTDISKNHSFEICCSAKEHLSFDICKKYTMNKICIAMPKVEGVEVVPESTDLVGYTGESIVTGLTIQNLQDKTDSFSITIWPPYWLGISATLEKSTVSIGANSETIIKLYFSIPTTAEEMILNFNVTVKSITDEKILDSQTVSLRTVNLECKYADFRVYSCSNVGWDNVTLILENLKNVELKNIKVYIRYTNDTISGAIMPADNTLPVTPSLKTFTFNNPEPGVAWTEVIVKTHCPDVTATSECK